MAFEAAQALPDRRRRTQEERTAGTMSALIEATITCLCELGYARTTTSEIVRRASCTTGAMQHHFGSKGELLIAVLDRVTEEFLAKYASFETLGGLPLEERCRFVLDGLWELYSSPRYVAIWEIFVGTRSEPELNRLCVAHRAGALAACERAWLAAFAELRDARPQLVDLMLLVVALLRSIGLNDALNPAPDAQLRQIAMLRRFVEQELNRIAGASDKG
jgi:AcrR family transcriptional regulator